jgi:hypothetical protein
LELTKTTKEIIKKGSARAKVNRAGIFQQITFKVITKSTANIKYTALFTDKIINASELSRLADEMGLPIEAPNCVVFPKGTSAVDFRI